MSITLLGGHLAKEPEFPSPLGELGMSIRNYKKKVWTLEKDSFRPLAGNQVYLLLKKM